MRRRGAAALLLAAWIFWPEPLRAHPVPFSYLDLRLHTDRVDAALVVHVFDAAYDLKIEPADRLLDPAFALSTAPALARLLAGRLAVRVNGRSLVPAWGDLEVLADRQSLRLHARLPLDAPPGSVTVEGRLFPYDPQHQTFINVYDGDALTQAVIDARKTGFDYFAGTRQGSLAVVRKFFPLGVRHILIGPDHILFLLALLLPGGTVRRFALIVTGFTVAHSITLTLATLDILNPPVRLIEPAIALSIVYVGADNLLVRDGRDVRAWIAFVFGFIHGFGFANVLREMDLPARALGWSLFSFNAGVEIGQLLIVVTAATALAAVQARSAALGRRLARAGSMVVVAAGAFWFVQRIMFPGGM